MTTATRPPGVAERDPSWRQHAACAGNDPELFFPGFNESAEPALAVCRHCPVRVPCGQWAYQQGEEHGVWGGLTAADRRNWQQRQPQQLRRCRTCRSLYQPTGPQQQYCRLACRPSGDPWTNHELAEVARLAAAGLADAEIGRQLGRPRSSVCAYRGKLGLQPGPTLIAEQGVAS